MKLSSLLNPELIMVRKPAALKETLIQNLIQEMVKIYPFEINKEEVMKALRERETLGETFLPGGIALPHARLDNFKDLLIGIAIPKTPIPRAPEPVRMIILILAPKTSSNLYLNSLAAIAKITTNKELFEKLLEAESPDAFITLIQNTGVEIKKEINVSDVMNTQFISVSPTTSIKDLCDEFCRYNSTFAAVTENGKFIGEVVLKDVISKGIPNYAQMMENLSFLTNFEPFEDLLKKEDEIMVKDVMRKHTTVIKHDSPVIQAAFELIQHERHTLPVVNKEQEIVGTVSHMDLLNNVLRK